MKIYDIAIVGSGPAGISALHSIVRAKLKVLWIEESSIGESRHSPFSYTQMIQNYRNGGQKIIYSWHPTPFAQPKAVGGGLAINAGLFQRVSKEVYNSWDMSSDQFWSWNSMQAEFDKLETSLGPFEAENEECPISQKMKRAAEVLNWKFKSISRLNLVRRLNFIDKSISSIQENGGHFLQSHRVVALKKIGSNWSIKCLCSNQEVVFLSKKVILCAGAIQTPALLNRSHLVPNILSSFKYHRSIKVVAEFPEDTNNQNIYFSPIQIKQFEPKLCIGSSISTKALIWSELIKSGISDLSILNQHKKQLMFYVSLQNSPKTFITNSHLMNDPVLISFGSKADEDLKFAVFKLLDFCFAMGSTRVHFCGKTISRDQDYDLSDISIYSSAIHLFSSLPLGGDLVDLHGRIINSENLFVTDGSIIPSSPAVNPQATIMAIAQRISKEIVASS